MLAITDKQFAVGVLGAVIIVALVLNRSMKGEFRGMKVQLGSQLESVDKAVNQREKGSPTMSQDVAEIRTITEALHELVAVGVVPRLDAVERNVSDLLARVSALEHPPAPPPPPTEEPHGTEPAHPT